MARQSRHPPVLLTRPLPQGARFAAMLRDRFGPGLRIVASPLLAPALRPGPPPPGPFAAVILTSETGARAAARWRDGLPRLAWCVGDRTAEVAAEGGFRARSAAGDADALVAAILADPPPGPVLHLRGGDSRGDVAARLAAAGLPARDLVVYDQRAQPLTDEAAALLTGAAPVLAPLFSPRTAARLAAERDRLALPAPLVLVALSAAVAGAAPPRAGDRAILAARPDAAAMLEAVAAGLATG